MYSELIIYWILFGLSHSLLAAGSVKSFFSSFMGAYYRYYRFGYTILAFLLLAWIYWFQLSHPDRIILRVPVYVRILALVVMFPALLVMGVCIRKYFFHLSGIGVFFPGKQKEDKLETGGLNSYVRHPLYSGTILFIWCVFFFLPTGGNLVDAGMVTVYTCIGTLFEEKKLRRSFGEAYISYQRKVPMLIPFTKRRK
jgi:protein-S-isoprenylcysteine O-methyltransferase Ste14